MAGNITPATHGMQATPKGRSLSFEFDRQGETLSGYVCTINVQRFPGDTPAITRVIAETSGKWTGLLTSAETAALSPTGTWMLIAAITNATTGAEEYQMVRFSLSEAL